MQRALEAIDPSEQQLSLTVGEDTWRMYIYGVTRVGHELFIQTALFGPRMCTAVVRVTARRTCRDTAREIVELITDWLSTGDRRSHVFLESATAMAPAC